MKNVFNKRENNLRVFSFVMGIILLTILVGCSTTTTELEVVGVTPNKDLLAQFAFEDRVYSIEGNKTPAEKINKEVGQIEKNVDEIKGDGHFKLFNSKIDHLGNASIFSIKDVDKDTVVAVKVNDIYYTAIVAGILD
ncbi:hypothetical protein MHH81_15835 [Psychrobacillus sp. FSL H8-0484]|uniref:hypothetical protein n=1 Tax=Psychrobacillus sp. FSL H8-0484 TaxID=2921390 RepID=UPI0030FADFE7